MNTDHDKSMPELVLSKNDADQSSETWEVKRIFTFSDLLNFMNWAHNNARRFIVKTTNESAWEAAHSVPSTRVGEKEVADYE